MQKHYSLGIELGSTRIKAMMIDENHQTVSGGEFTWASKLENGIWTYDITQVWNGLKTALSGIQNREKVGIVGISGMMHGYLAFDEDWNLLVPFRTWQNTVTAQAAKELTELLHFNLPQRWSSVHVYQAVLNREEHVRRIAHITTLAGYVHYMLTGVNAIGVGEASGMFPIDPATLDYDARMLETFNELPAVKEMPWRLEELLPKVLTAGEQAGYLTEKGSALLDGLLPEGVAFAPAEGDAGTGMVATNAVAPRTGNVSAGTSIFAMVVLEKALSAVYEEIDIVTTPSGKPVAMVHCNNCTNDTNAWASVLLEVAQLFGAEPSMGELFAGLYQKSLEGDADCGGVLVCNYMAGEGVTHLDSGRPMVVRRPDSKFTLSNFFRSQLYATMATLKLGMEILEQEQVAIDSLTGHGGLFKTPGVGQRYLAAACNTSVTCMETAGEGGPYGMALLAAYCANKTAGETLENYLSTRVFAKTQSTVMKPLEEDVLGFERYMQQYKKLLAVERMAAECL